VNIGAARLVGWLLASIGLLGVSLAREVLPFRTTELAGDAIRESVTEDLAAKLLYRTWSR
jgi:hypothetical protein